MACQHDQSSEGVVARHIFFSAHTADKLRSQCAGYDAIFSKGIISKDFWGESAHIESDFLAAITELINTLRQLNLISKFPGFQTFYSRTSILEILDGWVIHISCIFQRIVPT